MSLSTVRSATLRFMITIFLVRILELDASSLRLLNPCSVRAKYRLSSIRGCSTWRDAINSVGPGNPNRDAHKLDQMTDPRCVISHKRCAIGPRGGSRAGKLRTCCARVSRVKRLQALYGNKNCKRNFCGVDQSCLSRRGVSRGLPGGVSCVLRKGCRTRRVAVCRACCGGVYHACRVAVYCVASRDEAGRQSLGGRGRAVRSEISEKSSGRAAAAACPRSRMICSSSFPTVASSTSK